MGVALLDSLACRLSPSVPNQACSGGPTRSHPPGTLRHAWSTPSVLDADGATAVITCLASPVRNGSGSRAPFGGGGGTPGRNVERLPVGVAGSPEGRRGADCVGAGEPAAGDDDDAGGDDAGGSGVLAPVQAAGSIATTAMIAGIRRHAPTPPPCHARKRCAAGDRVQPTPMRMRGWAPGFSQRISRTSFACRMATQPAVAYPSVTCRKNALPLPGTTPVGELRVL
ncbi:MAG: hypothetical protein QOI15_2201 [Pseudonocardiales bacterium]|nr:hypothetical protein [Pseudonocardiales bacterium]